MASTLSLHAQDERVLLTVDGEPSTVSEFLYIYNKNQHEAQVTRQSLDEYLDMFVNFKLKVAAAHEAGLDTLASFKQELEGYRRQATPRYMTDTIALEKLIAQTHQNMLNDRSIRHIAIRCPYSASDSAVAAARGKIELARERVTTGIAKISGKGKNRKITHTPEDFANVALEVSDDPSVTDNAGLVGWVTPFRFVYTFEKAAFATPVGQVSEVFRTPFGFHILKVEAEQPHKEVNASHIMKLTSLLKTTDEKSRRTNDSIIQAAKLKIDSIYELAKAGENFGALAMAKSDDRGSAQRGGSLGWFGRNQMVREFEDVAFSMHQEGEISKPFRTNYGWHIMQFNGERGTGTLEETHDDIKARIMKSEHRLEVEKAFEDKLKQEYGFTENIAALSDFYAAAQGCNTLSDSAFVARIADLKEYMFTIDDVKYYQNDFTEYLSRNNKSQYGSMSAALDEKYEYFKANMLRETENRHLESKYPELRNLVKEYHDGIMLFDISLKEVWDKAGQDTAGLKRYFEEHKADYVWSAPRYKGWVIKAANPVALKAAKTIIKNFPADSVAKIVAQRINTDSVTYVRCERGLWEKGQNAAVDKLGFKDKKVELPQDSVFKYTVCVGKKLKGAEEYTDEQGKVTAAYQDYLEKQWLAKLHEKYPVVINKEVLESLRQELE